SCRTNWSPYRSRIIPGNPSLSLQTTRCSCGFIFRRSRYSAACAIRRLKKSRSRSCGRWEKRRATICDLEFQIALPSIRSRPSLIEMTSPSAGLPKTFSTSLEKTQSWPCKIRARGRTTIPAITTIVGQRGRLPNAVAAVSGGRLNPRFCHWDGGSYDGKRERLPYKPDRDYRQRY